jgi:predicted acetylornithine/succinylornithine family transaminase
MFSRYVVPNYGRFPVALVGGEGSHVWDAEGNRYLDLYCGAGCNLLGHCPPAVVEAVRDQLGRLIHVPQAWHTEPQAAWAQALSERSFGGQAFFCNSGSEAVEAAIKLARLHAKKPRYKIITFEGGFHGHTLAATAATAEPKVHEGLGPLMTGFSYAPFGDLEAIARAINDETAAVLVEPIQGDAGVRIPPDGFLAGLRRLADEHGLLLIFDEVQTGCGRTGEWFAYQGCGVTPDVMALSGGLCGGLAGGAMLTTAEIAQSLRPTAHGCSFGGNPLAARAGLAVIETIERDGLLENAKQLGELFRRRLEAIRQECPLVRQVRIRGLMIGIELSIEGAVTVKACLERRLLVNCTAGNVIRLLPAINLANEQAEDACDVLGEALKERGARD